MIPCYLFKLAPNHQKKAVITENHRNETIKPENGRPRQIKS